MMTSGNMFTDGPKDTTIATFPSGSPSLKSLGVENVHLISGETIVGRVLEGNAGTWLTIERPMMPTIAPTENGKMMLSLLPLIPYMGMIDKVDVLATNVMYRVPVNDRLLSLYTESTSNIKLATSGNIQL